jgi:nodulation protein E
MNRVVITGMGVICGVGHNVSEFWNSLIVGNHGFRPLQGMDTSGLRQNIVCQVQNYQPATYFELKSADLLDRFAQFGVIAARQALQQSGELADPDEVGVFTGCAIGGKESEDKEFYAIYAEKKSRVHPMTIVRTMANGAASAISQEHGFRGPVINLSTACSSSNHAIGSAFHAIRAGQMQAAIAGGSESMFSFGILKAWEAMRVVSGDVCRPFSKDRKGLVLGEGAAMLVLESLDAARARGAEILGEITGFGSSSDAGHITQPDPEGAALALKRTLRDARCEIQKVGYINAHGTGTTANDVMESQAIRAVFGQNSPLISSTKSMHGHALGAAGALETVATLMALKEGLIPPTANFVDPDPECLGLDFVPNQARECKINVALSNSFAFGGLNASLVLQRFQ